MEGKRGDICGILLAAGASRRFGGDKLLHPMEDGVAMAAHAARNLLGAVSDVLAVVRWGDFPLYELLEEEGCRVTMFEHAARGMGASLAHGVAETRGAAGWIVALADMPRIRPGTMRTIVDALRNGDALAAPAYRGERGHPVGFDARFCEELMALSDDEGARRILARHRDALRVIECDDPAVLLDVDARSDLARLRRTDPMSDGASAGPERAAASAEPARDTAASQGGSARAAGHLPGLWRNLRCGARIALLQRPGIEEIEFSAEAFAVLTLANLVLLLALDFAVTGVDGAFHYHELPRALLAVPLLLALGLLVSRGDPGGRTLLLLPVALTAAGMVLTVFVGALSLGLQHAPGSLPVAYQRFVEPVALLWWAAAVAIAVARLAGGGTALRLRNVAAAWLLAVGPAWLLPQGALWGPRYGDGLPPAGFGGIAEESAFYAQHDALARALAALEPERPGVADLYLVAAGFYAREDVFMKEVQLIEKLFRERFDTRGRAVTLINNPAAVHEHPLATATSLAAALKHVGEVMNPEEDVLVLYLSSHGSEDHRLAVDFWPLRLVPIDPAAVKRAVDESGIRWRVVVVSACYSGGFMEPLKDERSLVITASSANRQSFGCGVDSDATFLAKALFDEELRRTHSFETAFENARRSIAARERERNFAPSEPRIHVGTAIREKLAEIERRLGGVP